MALYISDANGQLNKVAGNFGEDAGKANIDASNLSSANVNSWHSVLDNNKIIKDSDFTSTTSLTISGLDLPNGRYELMCWCKAVSAGFDCYLTINNITSGNNYHWTKISVWNGGSINGSGVNYSNNITFGSIHTDPGWFKIVFEKRNDYVSIDFQTMSRSGDTFGRWGSGYLTMPSNTNITQLNISGGNFNGHYTLRKVF